MHICLYAYWSRSSLSPLSGPRHIKMQNCEGNVLHDSDSFILRPIESFVCRCEERSTTSSPPLQYKAHQMHRQSKDKKSANLVWTEKPAKFGFGQDNP
jgi:hypothetical protein